MSTTRSHAPIRTVLHEAGYGAPPSPSPYALGPGDHDERWMEDRRLSLVRMRAKRDHRRAAGPDGETDTEGTPRSRAAAGEHPKLAYEPELGYESDPGSVAGGSASSASSLAPEKPALAATAPPAPRYEPLPAKGQSQPQPQSQLRASTHPQPHPPRHNGYARPREKERSATMETTLTGGTLVNPPSPPPPPPLPTDRERQRQRKALRVANPDGKAFDEDASDRERERERERRERERRRDPFARKHHSGRSGGYDEWSKPTPQRARTGQYTSENARGGGRYESGEMVSYGYRQQVRA